MMTTMEERVAARYASSQRVSMSGYGPHFQRIVQVVDDLATAAKKLPTAKTTLEHLKGMIRRDPDVKDNADRVFGLEQQIGDMEKEIDAVGKAVSSLESTYDNFNSWFLEKGLK